jgi:hypothetical protein
MVLTVQSRPHFSLAGRLERRVGEDDSRPRGRVQWYSQRGCTAAVRVGDRCDLALKPRCVGMLQRTARRGGARGFALLSR